MYYKLGIALVLALAIIISYDPRAMLQIVASLTNDSRGTNDDCNMFILQATGGLFDDSVLTIKKLTCQNINLQLQLFLCIMACTKDI